MKKCVVISILACLVLLWLESCERNLLGMLEKREYFSFIRNESGKDVKVILDKGSSIEKAYQIIDGEELEIPDTDRTALYIRPPKTISWTAIPMAQAPGKSQRSGLKNTSWSIQ